MLILTPFAVESAWEAICLLVERSYQEYGVRYVCIDTETEPKDGAPPDDALIYGRAFLKVTSLAVFGQSFSFPTNRLSPSYPTSIYWRDHLLKKIWAKAATAGWVVVCHNSNYDLNIFYAELGMPTPKKIWCTMIGAWAASPYIEKGLKSRAYRYGRVLTETKHIDFSNLRKLADYAEQDVIQTEELFLAQNNIPFKRPPAIFPLVHKKGSYGKFRVDQLLVDAETLLLPEKPIIPADEKLTEASSNWVSRVELPVLRSTMRAERRGFPFIVNRLRSIREKVNEDKKACLKTIYQLAGEKVNIGSNPQMSAIFQKLGIQNPYKTKKSGKQSFDAKSMHLIGLATGHPFVAAVVKLTGLKKMASVYTGDRDYDPEEHNEDCGLEYYYNPDTGCIHCSLATVGAVTGRSSCCVSGDTLLPTNRGTFRFDEYLPQEGDTVISHLRRECRVLSKIYKGRAPMFRFTLSNGAQLKATGRHIVFCEGFKERMLATLTVGDRVLSYECKHDKSPVGEVSGASSSKIPYAGTQDLVSNWEGVRNEPRDCLRGFEDSANTRTVYGGKTQEIFRHENRGIKPYEGQEWFPTPQLHWGNRGRPWVSSEESLWEVSACSPIGYSESRRSKASAEGLCSSSCRRKQEEQQVEQPLPAEFRRTLSASLLSAEIVKIEALGIQDVWDIQVEGDHSYLAENFVNHNSSPNLQQVPSRKDSYALKRAFGFEDDDDYSLIVLDHSQLELRVMAALCCDPKMCEILRDRKGDLHQFTADMFEVPRDPDAKQLNFLLLYGGQAKMMASQLTFSGSPTSEVQCQQYIRRHTEVYPRVSEYRKELLMEHQKCGRTTLLLQRHRHLPGINWNDSHSVHKAETTLSNNVVQGCLLGSTRLLLDSGGEETEIQSLMLRYKLGKRGQKIWSGSSWETVTDVFSVGKKPLWKVKLSDGTTFQTSDTHLWKNELGEWVKTANLAKGDFIQQSLKVQTRALPCAYSPDYSFLRVVSVEDCRKQVEMFDLTVEPSHQYAAWNGAIMHNSGQDLLKAGIIRLDYSCYNPDSSMLEAGIGHRRHREVCTYYARKLEKYRKVLRSGKCKYLLQVHDELVFRVKREAAEECAHICAEVMSWESFMPSIYDFSNKSYPVPFVAEGGVAQNWKDAKSKDKARFHVKVGYDTWEKFAAV